MSENASQLKQRFTTGKTVTSESMNAMVDALAVSSTTKETLKSYFETGDKPTQAQFYELIDAIFEQQAFDTLNWIDVSTYIYGKYEQSQNIVFTNNNATDCDGQSNSILVNSVMSNTSTNLKALNQILGHTASVFGSITSIKFAIEVQVVANSSAYPFARAVTYTVQMPFMYQQPSMLWNNATREEFYKNQAFNTPLGQIIDVPYPYNDLTLYMVPFISVYDNLNGAYACAVFVIMSPQKSSVAYDFLDDAPSFTSTVSIKSKVTGAWILDSNYCKITTAVS